MSDGNLDGKEISRHTSIAKVKLAQKEIMKGCIGCFSYYKVA